MMETLSAVHIHITGIVQGVGFRPFVYGLAERSGLTGWVRNTSAGVEIEAAGKPGDLQEFIHILQTQAPPLARIDDIQVQPCTANGYTSFQILTSEAQAGAFQPISPDVCTCEDCLRELFDPTNRRYRYPFINCTNCGPRFTIIRDIPYDRLNTTMAGFPLCPDCLAEYQDPADRRFHAEPVACPACGPQLWLECQGARMADGDEALLTARRMLQEGKILAVKGLGGFHLACDALNAAAVDELRRRKRRVEKPFALMAADLQSIERHCYIAPQERQLLESPQRPIVILRRRPDSPVAPGIAPGQHTLGFMLPYTPLHYLLLADTLPGQALVMTSGNLSEEPIATDNDEARSRLSALADAFLMHDRPIHTRCDDSVVRVLVPGMSIPSSGIPRQSEPAAQPMMLRRARGYAPQPVHLPWESVPLLAAGAELKNTFCLASGTYAFLSQHIGDLQNWETLQAFEQGVAHFELLFHIRPEVLAYDLHPDYLATRYALRRAREEGLPAVGVQHHHAHIAACMAENGLKGDDLVIGAAFDGTGYGTDGTIWGGEFLIAGYSGFQRRAHLDSFPLPGGDAAVQRPARAALAALQYYGLSWDPDLPPAQDLNAQEQRALRFQLEQGINTPLTSSMGRLFDVVAALAGVRQRVNYEAQAAVELEALVDPHESGLYEFDLQSGESLVIHPGPLLEAVVADVLSGAAVKTIAARFHNGLAQMVLQVCERLRRDSGLTTVALSGGVWQNLTLLQKTVPLLQENGFEVLLHRLVPANDGGLALGQAAVASHWRRHVSGSTRENR